MNPSSGDLHPRSGARFVLVREDDTYRVQVFLPGGETLTTTLRWDADGRTRLDPPLRCAAAHDEVLKLARVLRRTPKQRLTRWRPLA